MESDKQRRYEKKFETKIHISRPRQMLYEYWRNLENLPCFMNHVDSVKILNDRKFHLVEKSSLGRKVGWDGEIVTEHKNEVMSWRSLKNSGIENAGSVRFEDAPAGTEVKLELAYNPPGGAIRKLFLKILGGEPSRQFEQDLRHFKNLMEQKISCGCF